MKILSKIYRSIPEHFINTKTSEGFARFSCTNLSGEKSIRPSAPELQEELTHLPGELSVAGAGSVHNAALWTVEHHAGLAAHWAATPGAHARGRWRPGRHLRAVNNISCWSSKTGFWRFFWNIRRHYYHWDCLHSIQNSCILCSVSTSYSDWQLPVQTDCPHPIQTVHILFRQTVHILIRQTVHVLFRQTVHILLGQAVHIEFRLSTSCSPFPHPIQPVHIMFSLYTSCWACPHPALPVHILFSLSTSCSPCPHPIPPVHILFSLSTYSSTCPHPVQTDIELFQAVHD